MNQVQAARFPQVSGLQAKLDNLLISRRPRLQLATDDDLAVVELRPGADLRSDLQHYPLRAGDASLWIAVAPGVVARLGSPWLDGGPRLEELPATLRSAALAAALSPLLDAIASQLGISATLRDDGDDPPTDATVLSLAWESARLPEGLIYLDARVTAALCDALQDIDPVENGLDETTVSSDLALEVANIALTVEELRALSRGDILVLPPETPPPGSTLILSLPGRAVAQARLENNTLVVERLLETAMVDDDDRKAPISADDQPAADDLEIRLDFDLGSLSIPLSELRQLGPDSTIELESIPDGQVRIRSGRQVIGSGELVQIDDRLAVRVKSLFGSHRG